MVDNANRRYYPNQAYLNALFEQYEISFRNPNRIVNILVYLITDDLGDRGFTDDDDYYDAMQQTKAQGLHDIVEDISRLPLHRHRTDARNIIREVESQVYQSAPPTILVPSPEETPFEGPGARKPDFSPKEIEDHYRAELLDNVGRLLWRPGDDFPPAWRAPQTQVRTTYVPAENSDLLELIVQDAATTQSMRAAMLNLLSSGEHPFAFKPPVCLDDPAEICLAMPEDCRFITAPTPRSDRMDELLDVPLPKLQVWDLRLGDRSTGRLGAQHYIYRLVSLVRRTVSNPDIARAYAFIFRAYPAKYAAFSDDEIVDEAPATAEEVECVIAFMTQTFPEIEIKEIEDGAAAYHDRGFLNVINLSSKLFDDIEEIHRQGEGVGHLLYHIFVTLIHELGHWFYSCIYLQRQVMPGVLRTPRKLRLYVLPGGPAEDPWRPGSDMTDVLYGELGQLIEWLIFGHVADVNTYRPGTLTVTCWGSYAEQGWRQITINSYAASRLLATRPPVRMDAPALRNFIAAMAEEEAQSSSEPDSISGQLLDDLDMPDVDRQYTGYNLGPERTYRRAVHRVRDEAMRKRKLRPIAPREVRERRQIGPLGLPGVARRFWALGSVAFAVVASFVVGLAFGYDPLGFEPYRVLFDRLMGLSGWVVVLVLVLLLVVLWLISGI